MKWLEEVTDMYGITRKELTPDGELVLIGICLIVAIIALFFTVFS